MNPQRIYIIGKRNADEGTRSPSLGGLKGGDGDEMICAYREKVRSFMAGE